MKSAESATRDSGEIGMGYLLVVLAAVLWSTSGLFAKAPVFDNWDLDSRVTILAFWRTVFAGAVIVLFIRNPRWNWRMIPMMVCFAAMCWSFLQALVATESTTAIWLQYTAPVFVLLGGVVLFHEKIRRHDIWFVLGSLSGLAIILSGQIGEASGAGLVYGILAGFFFAGVILSLRGLREYDSAWLVFLNQFATAALLLPVYLTLDARPSGTQWWYLIGFGSLQLGIPYLLFARGLRSVSSHEAALIVLLEPLLVPFWVYLVWRYADGYEPPRLTTLIGGALILASLSIRYGSRLVRFRRRPS